MVGIVLVRRCGRISTTIAAWWWLCMLTASDKVLVDVSSRQDCVV